MGFKWHKNVLKSDGAFGLMVPIRGGWGPIAFISLAQGFKSKVSRHSYHGSVEMNLTGMHEDAGSIPGLAQWGKDPTLP